MPIASASSQYQNWFTSEEPHVSLYTHFLALSDPEKKHFKRLLSGYKSTLHSIEGLNQLPVEKIAGELFYVAGNTPFAESTIRLVAECHLPEVGVQKWNALRKLVSPQDVLFVEGARDTVQIRGSKKYTLAQNETLSRVPTHGWESFEGMEVVDLHAKLSESIKKLEHLFDRLQDACDDKAQDLFVSPVFDALWSLLSFEEGDVLTSLARHANDTCRGERKRREAGCDLKDGIMNLYQKYRDIYSETLALVSGESIALRNRNIIKVLEAHEGKVRYLVAGIAHVPLPGNEKSAQLDEIRRYLAGKKYTVLVPSTVLAHQQESLCFYEEALERYFPFMQGHLHRVTEEFFQP